MPELPIPLILPLLILTSPLVALASESALVPIALGREYTGALTPSPSNPQGEFCYKLAVKPDTRIALNVKTSGVGIIKFAVYDRAKALRFYHNHVNNQPLAAGIAPTASKFSFPAIADAAQLCLTTSNARRGQRYDLIVTAQPSRKAKSQLKLRSIAANPVAPSVAPRRRPAPRLPDLAPPITSIPSLAPILPPMPIAETIATVELPPQTSGAPYCYVGTWQVKDLNGYWLPNVQNLTQAQITNSQMLGYAKVTLTKDGNATFEAIDLEQRYTLRSKDSQAKIDKIGVNLAGTSSAKFQSDYYDGSLTFSSQDYRRLTTKINFGDGWKLTGEKLFTFFGDGATESQSQGDLRSAKLPYKCLDRDNMTMRVPLANGQKLIPIAFKRVN